MQIMLSNAYCGVEGCEFFDQEVEAYAEVDGFGEYWADDAGISEQCGHTVSGEYSWTIEDQKESIYDY